MARRSRHHPAADRVKQLRQRIDRWRSTRSKLWPMPPELWEEAAALARELGLHPVKGELGLNYQSLKRRLGAEEPTTSDAGSRVEFVELSGAQLLGGSVVAGPILEISDASGVRLTLRLAPGSAVDVGRLLEAFRGRAA